MSGSPDGEEFQITLTPELHDWLRDHAEEVDVEPETIAFESLAAYRVAAKYEGDLEGDESGLETDSELFADLISANFESRFEEIESDFREKIEDVRERVIQVKKEADANAPADHSHDEYVRLEDLESRLSEVEEDYQSLEASVNEISAEVDNHIENVDEESEVIRKEIGTIKNRLTKVAWVVNDLREFAETQDEPGTLKEIKQHAAAANASRAKCDKCRNNVDIGLLTEAACPHCEGAFAEFEASDLFFSSPKLRNSE